MKIFSKFTQWWALKKAKKEESKHLPNKKEMHHEQKEFLEEAKELKTMIIKK